MAISALNHLSVHLICSTNSLSAVSALIVSEFTLGCFCLDCSACRIFICLRLHVVHLYEGLQLAHHHVVVLRLSRCLLLHFCWWSVGMLVPPSPLVALNLDFDALCVTLLLVVALGVDCVALSTVRAHLVPLAA